MQLKMYTIIPTVCYNSLDGNVEHPNFPDTFFDLQNLILTPPLLNECIFHRY